MKDIKVKVDGTLFCLTADAVIKRGDKVLLVKRNVEPHKGMWTLPGGRVKIGETLHEGLIREVSEETGLTAKPKKMIGVYDALHRDPRGRFVSVAFNATAKGALVKKTNETSDAQWFPLNTLPTLGFDHRKIIKDSLNNL